MSAIIFPTRALYEEVAELLRQRIFSRELEPGSWIDELRIAEELGISRTPLREALKVLATEGLVTMKMRRGAYVTEVNEKDLRDVYHLLALLESDAARVVAQNASDEQLAQLSLLHQKLIDATNDRDRFFEINESFHKTLLELSDNKWRTQIVIDLRKVLKLFGRASGCHGCYGAARRRRCGAENVCSFYEWFGCGALSLEIKRYIPISLRKYYTLGHVESTKESVHACFSIFHSCSGLFGYSCPC
jgi:DNA-binding GntR family transcriptional regulator